MTLHDWSLHQKCETFKGGYMYVVCVAICILQYGVSIINHVFFSSIYSNCDIIRLALLSSKITCPSINYHRVNRGTQDFYFCLMNQELIVLIFGVNTRATHFIFVTKKSLHCLDTYG